MSESVLADQIESSLPLSPRPRTSHVSRFFLCVYFFQLFQFVDATPSIVHCMPQLGGFRKEVTRVAVA
ncbi:hypothetical protein GQ42DRAFT_164733 [Ramicandelaber brevisporus]|nr:hypothetical protein GQ42DRAFT_164733 [Ramicandelaber brevisporus]